jgi:hypothetical protein
VGVNDGGQVFYLRCKTAHLQARRSWTRPARMLGLRRWHFYCPSCGQTWPEPRPLRARAWATWWHLTGWIRYRPGLRWTRHGFRRRPLQNHDDRR